MYIVLLLLLVLLLSFLGDVYISFSGGPPTKFALWYEYLITNFTKHKDQSLVHTWNMVSTQT